MLKNYYCHRIAWKMVTGGEPEHLDHISGRPDDNRIVNLRAVSRSENMRNCKRPVTNKSGRVGVFRVRKKWEAQIVGRFGQESLGRFACFGQACRVRAAAEKEHGYNLRSRLNFGLNA